MITLNGVRKSFRRTTKVILENNSTIMTSYRVSITEQTTAKCYLFVNYFVFYSFYYFVTKTFYAQIDKSIVPIFHMFQRWKALVFHIYLTETLYHSTNTIFFLKTLMKN